MEESTECAYCRAPQNVHYNDCQRPRGPESSVIALRASVAVLRAKVAMYEAWLREHHPDCELLVENILAGGEGGG